MKILYIHPASPYGGASKSLVELYQELSTKGVEGAVITPFGSASNAFVKAGLYVINIKGLPQFDNTRIGYYRKHRWLILIRELFFLPFSLWRLWQLRNKSFDLIHLNDITLLPFGVVASLLLRIPMVVHVRSLQRAPGSGVRTKWINYLLRQHASAILAIDSTVARTLDESLPYKIVHNGIKIEGDENYPAQLKSSRGVVSIGFLGVLTPMKGIYELVEALHILNSRGIIFECLIAGENPREIVGLRGWALKYFGFAKNVRQDIEGLITKYGLEHRVRLLGFVKDVRELYPLMDIVCFPSFLDAAGRPVFEAAFYGIPSVVAVNKPMPDAVINEVTGLSIVAPSPILIAEALERLILDENFRKTLGLNARKWAKETFSIENSAHIVYSTYQEILTT